MFYLLLAIVCLFSPYVMGMYTKDMQKISTYQCAKPFVNTLVVYSTSIEALNKGAYEMDPDSPSNYGYVHKFLSRGTYGSANDPAYRLVRLSKQDVAPVLYSMTTHAMTQNCLYMRPATVDEAAVVRRAIQEKQAKFTGQNISTGQNTFLELEGRALLQLY